MQDPVLSVRWLFLIPVVSAFIGTAGCHYNAELHRRTVPREVYDSLCAKGIRLWRMYYEGTDSAFHRFLVNDMDIWRHVRVPKADIRLEETLPPMEAERSLGYYCVDPCREWRKVDQCSLQGS